MRITIGFTTVPKDELVPLEIMEVMIKIINLLTSIKGIYNVNINMEKANDVVRMK